MLSITSIAAEAIPFGRSLQNDSKAIEKLHEKYKNLPPVHTINNLALVVWGLLAGEDDLIKAIGQTVAAGGNTDCNGAAAGGFWGLSGKPIPNHWTNPWQGGEQGRRTGTAMQLCVSQLSLKREHNL